LKPSAANKNKKGERGSPWRRPRSIGNSYVGLPLTRTDDVAVPTHSKIHFRQRVGKFIFIITSSRYFKSTESYAFSKSTLNIISSLSRRLTSSTTSLAIKIPSKICFSWIKDDWVSETTLPITYAVCLLKPYINIPLKK